MIPLARHRPRLAVAQVLAILALLLLTLVLPSWWRWLGLAASAALAANLLRVALSRPRLELDRTTLKIRTPPRTRSVHRRDVLLAVPLHAARRGAPNLRLRLRNDTTRVDLNALNPAAAVRDLLEWIGKGPAKEDARELLLTRLADTLHTKIAAAQVRSARRTTRTRPLNARRQSPAQAGVVVDSWDARIFLLARLATAFRSVAAARGLVTEVDAGGGTTAPSLWLVVPPAVPDTWPRSASALVSQTVNRPVTSATPTWPADPVEARRLALTRVAIALHAATRPFTVGDKGGS